MTRLQPRQLLLAFAAFAVATAVDLQLPMTTDSDPVKVPGASPAYHCSDPSKDLFQFTDLNFYPTNPRIGFYLEIKMWGNFVADTGDVPWLNVTGSVDGREERSPMYNSPLCDIDVFQDVEIPVPGDDPRVGVFHRSCPPRIHQGRAVISSPPMPLYPDAVPTGRWKVRAEAFTQDQRRIFCVQGEFDVTK